MQFAASTTSTGPPSSVGRWTHAPFQIPHAAINAAMLPTGEVMFWGRSFPNEPRSRGNAALWDPSKGYGSDAFTEVPPPSIDPDGPGPQGTDTAPLLCSGLSMLASGEVLVTGGNLVGPGQYSDDPYTDYAGLNRVFTFNPWTRTWTEQPQMNAGRWYPGQVELADGRTVVLSGYTDEPPGGIINRDLEVFTPAAQPGGVGSVTLVPSAQRKTALYPHLFTLPNSSVLLAGPGRSDSALLSTTDFTWQALPPSSRVRTGGNAVLDPLGGPAGSWRVTQIGGYPIPADAQGTHHATASTETIDARYPGQGWKSGPSLNLPRSYQNTVLLPDRSMVTLGGGIGYTVADEYYAIDSTGERRQVELWDPATRKWRLGPAEIEDRGYHSTALLLPSGRVWSAGDEKHPLEPDGGFSLTRHRGALLAALPVQGHATEDRLRAQPTELGQTVLGARLIRASPSTRPSWSPPAATTHGADSNQRLVKLAVRRTYANGIDLTAPPNARRGAARLLHALRSPPGRAVGRLVGAAHRGLDPGISPRWPSATSAPTRGRFALLSRSASPEPPRPFRRARRHP